MSEKTKFRILSIVINIAILAHVVQMLVFMPEVRYDVGMFILAIGWAIYNIDAVVKI